MTRQRAGIRIAGVRIELHYRSSVIAGLLEALGPFRALGERTVADEVQLDLEIVDEVPKAPPGPSDFVYLRHDLAFGLDADRRHGAVWLTAGRPALEATIELALNSVLLARGGAVFHASSGVIDGAAWLIPGESGAGKSTAARNGGFDRVLADEMVAVRPRRDGTKEGFEVWGTPFWSRGRDRPFDTGSAPLAVVAKPVKASVVEVAPLSVESAALLLARCVTVYGHGASIRQRAFERACDVAARCRLVQLGFPKEGPWISKALSLLEAASSNTPKNAPSRCGSTGI